MAGCALLFTGFIFYISACTRSPAREINVSFQRVLTDTSHSCLKEVLIGSNYPDMTLGYEDYYDALRHNYDQIISQLEIDLHHYEDSILSARSNKVIDLISCWRDNDPQTCDKYFISFNLSNGNGINSSDPKVQKLDSQMISIDRWFEDQMGVGEVYATKVQQFADRYLEDGLKIYEAQIRK